MQKLLLTKYVSIQKISVKNGLLQKQIIFKKKYTKQDIINMNREELLKTFNFIISFEDKSLKLIFPNSDLEINPFLDRTQLLSFAKEEYKEET